LLEIIATRKIKHNLPVGDGDGKRKLRMFTIENVNKRVGEVALTNGKG
jgi:hypothetical protein